jgi:hypothetical protein
MKKKVRKTKSTKRETCSYIFEIKDWEFSYSFAVNHNKNIIEGPFWEHTDLKVKGKLAHPEKLKDKEIEVTIMGSRRETRVVNKPEDYDSAEPKAVGTITIRGKQSELLCWVPFDAFQMLCSMLNAGRIKYLILTGQSLYHGSADIRSMCFQEHFGPEDIG